MAAESRRMSLKDNLLAPGARLCEDLTVLRHVGGSRRMDIYLCRSRRYKGHVACKVLRYPWRAQYEGLEAFVREGNVLMELRHPHIVEGYDVSLEGRPHIVMEHLSGGNVADTFFSGNYESFAVEDFIKVAADMADALTCAHERGILHLDVRPSNVVFQNGQAHLIDFNAMRFFHPGMHVRTDAGACEYTAPEQVQDGDLGYYTDVFGLGVLFYQLLTGGSLPYEILEDMDDIGGGKPSRTLNYSVEPIFPAEINHAVPDEIAEVALRAIHPQANKRYESTAEFKEALRTAAETARAMAPFQAVLRALRRPSRG